VDMPVFIKILFPASAGTSWNTFTTIP
jgi:hypothetical protein